jgi:hypothetical protein
MQLPTDSSFSGSGSGSGSGLTAELARRLARRLESNPEFLASVFRRYREAQGFDDARFAHHLGVADDTVARLAICRRPRHDEQDAMRFGADVASIAEAFDLEPMVLAELVRFVDVIDAVAAAPTGAVAAGFLAAAKERAAEERASYDLEDDDTPENGDADDDPGDDR